MLVLIAAAITAGCSPDREGVGGAAVAEPQQPRYWTLIVPYGTPVIASLDTRISTRTNRSGDRFSATTIAPVLVGNQIVIPVGARINGVLRDVRASGRIKGRARMTLIYQGIVDLAATNHAILALPLRLQAASATPIDDRKNPAGGVSGAMGRVIAATGGGEAIGKGAETLFTLESEGDEVELGAGQRLSVWTTSPTSIGVLAQR